MVENHREGMGLTRQELAQKAQITTAYASMLAAGKRKSPSLPLLERLATAPGGPVTELSS